MVGIIKSLFDTGDRRQENLTSVQDRESSDPERAWQDIMDDLLTPYDMPLPTSLTIEAVSPWLSEIVGSVGSLTIESQDQHLRAVGLSHSQPTLEELLPQLLLVLVIFCQIVRYIFLTI